MRIHDLKCLCVAVALCCEFAMSAQATPRNFTIEAEDASRALLEFGRQSSVQILFASEKVSGITTNAVHGDFEPIDALKMLLKGTPLIVSQKADGVLVVDLSAVHSAIRIPDVVPAAIEERGRSSSGDYRVAQVDQIKGTQSSAVGQTSYSQENSDHSSVGLDEIVVTAQKRAERLHDVPIAVSAFNQNTINNLGISDVQSLSRVVPGLSFTSKGSGEPIVTLRGISSGYGLSPAVGLYVDETPIDIRTDHSVGTSLIDLFDIDHIEVLRGPQGTLFGASSMGGTIRLLTAQPDPTNVVVRVEAGGADTHGGSPSYDFKGAVNIPINPELAIRVVATHEYEGGFIDRLLPTDLSALTGREPITKKDENTTERTSFRFAAGWTPSSSLTITPSFIYQRTDTNGDPTSILEPSSYVNAHVFPTNGTFRTIIGSLKIDENLGFADFISSSSYLDKRTLNNIDFGNYGQYVLSLFGVGPTVPSASILFPVNYKQWAQELRLTSSNNAAIRWVAGGYFNQTDQENNEYFTSDAFTPLLGTPNALTYDAPTRDRQVAIFGELTYVPIQQLEITAGLRGYNLHQTLQITQGGILGGPNVPKTSTDRSGANPKFTVAYKPNGDLNLYGTVAKGFRPGGVNTGITTAPCEGLDAAYKPFYDPDHVWNYEVGAKTNLFGGRATVNLDGYILDWSNIQGSIPAHCGTFNANIGKARTKGFELETSAKVNEYLSFSGGAAYTDAKITSVFPLLSDLGIGAPGQRIPDSARIQFNLGGDLEAPLGGEHWMLFLHPEWQYVGSIPGSYVNTEQTSRPAYSNVDITAGIRHGGIELSTYVRNLTDSVQVQAATVDPIYGFKSYTVGRPRTVGVQFRYSY